ncbi:NUDIX domain-containing protein [Cytobacillus sp. Hm23]
MALLVKIVSLENTKNNLLGIMNVRTYFNETEYSLDIDTINRGDKNEEEQKDYAVYFKCWLLEIQFIMYSGGIEIEETPEEGAKREAIEELGVTVNISECFAIVQYNGTQYFPLLR